MQIQLIRNATSRITYGNRNQTLLLHTPAEQVLKPELRSLCMDRKPSKSVGQLINLL